MACGAVRFSILQASSRLRSDGAPVVFKSLNTGLVALATNALVFVVVALLTPNTTRRAIAAQPA